MTATERNQATCLPAEAYLKIINSCSSQDQPKFRSSVFPKQTTQIKTKPKK
jgi:hypothetical protein